MKRSRGQALIEFALVSPILLLLIMGIFDFSRVFITFAITSNSLRSALRLAEVRGVATSTGTVANPGYLDCERMRVAARNVLFADTPTIDIMYQDARTPLTSPTIRPCSGSTMTASLVQNGDMLRISVSATVKFITPLISNMWPSVTINLTGQRTIVSQIQLGSAANLAADSEFDGLNDAWEIRWFGNLSQVAGNDLDNDGCNNGCEETRNTNPFVRDTDGDTVPDGQEAGCDLDPNSSSTINLDNDGLDANLECVLNLDDNIADWDLDGLTDGYEYYTSRTNPALADSDGDGLSDGYEVANSSNPLARDTDRDGLWDPAEVLAGTLIANADSDSDSLLDGEEAGYSDRSFAGTGTNPMMADTDRDQLSDGYELMISDADPRVMDANDTNPLIADTDGDGLMDNLEVLLFHTNPRSADTDGDTLTDYQEINGTAVTVACGLLAPTNPLVVDTDGDTVPDDVDCASNYDSDRDLLLDAWEFRYFPGNLLALTAAADLDADGCDNYCEQTFDTNPRVIDTDNDGIDDGLETVEAWSYRYPRTNPLITDTDGDGIKDGDEVANNIDPWNRDTDSDGLTDFQELRAGTYTGLGTSPTNADSDNDRLKDGDEVSFASRGYSVTVNGVVTAVTQALNPLSTDSDGDGLWDGNEVLIWHTHPMLSDTDGDGLSDGAQELLVIDAAQPVDTDQLVMDSNDTDPLMPDTDGDTLRDGVERNTWHTDPRDTDSDNDTLTDAYEVAFTGLSVTVNGTSTAVSCTLSALDDDKDNDRVLDGAEVNRAGGATNPCNADTDGDQLCDGAFVVAGICPLPLGGEANRSMRYTVNENITSTVTISTNPLRTDSDGDTLADNVEVTERTLGGQTLMTTDPMLVDTDADGVNDNLDPYPNNQPTLTILRCKLNVCAQTEPTNTTRAYQEFTIEVMYNNSARFSVSYDVVPVLTAVTEYRVRPLNNTTEVCDTSGNENYDFRVLDDENRFESTTAVGTTTWDPDIVEICRDKRSLGVSYSGIVRDPATETYTVSFWLNDPDRTFIRAGVPLTFNVTLTNK